MAGPDTELDILKRILDGQEKPRRLELALLRTITENFSDARIIGSGGCGAVYKGVLRNGSGTVAVKKLFKTHTIDEKMFNREVHSMMTVKHDNIVQFLGYCSDTQGESIEIEGKRVMGDVRERLICFEHIKNGSLRNHIKDELRGLKWHERYKIIKGICEGLHHLHKEKCIRHMDLKPDNILLGDHLIPKITDFGLARLDDKSQTTSEQRLFSLGYCAPEYHCYGKMSAKSDIYSLGVIILEVVTGSKEDPDIPKVLRRWRHRWNKSSEDTPLLWYRQVAKCLDLTKWCKRNNPIGRPNIWDIISELNEIDSWDGQIRYATVSTFDRIMSCLEGMLGIEPLEMHFRFVLNESMSCSIEINNDTDDYFAFRIASTSLLPFSTQKDKGIVKPRSTLSATVTLQAQDKALLQNHWSEEFSVQSSRIEGIPTSMDVTKDMFDDVMGKVVDEVNLTVVFDVPPAPEEDQIDMDTIKYQEADNASAKPHSRANNGSLGPSFQIESCNNALEMQSVNNIGPMEELDKLLERLRIPQEFATSLTGGSFEESQMPITEAACEWLTGAILSLEVPNLGPCYVDMRAVREKIAELEKLKTTFVQRASEFLQNYFSSLVVFMLSDKSFFSQRGQLKRPDHAVLRYKCRPYARLLQHLKTLDRSCLGPLRKAYCHSLSLLLRREAGKFVNELRASTKAPKNLAVWFEGSNGSGPNGSSADTSIVSDAYSKMLTIFIPMLEDESSYFAHFMCFEVSALPTEAPNVNKGISENDADDDLGLLDPDGNDLKPDDTSAELGALNEAIQELLDRMQEDFYEVIDWAYKIDPLCCISMHGITKRYLYERKAEPAGFVRKLLDDLESRISEQLSRFIDEACRQIECNERKVRQTGILAYIPRFAVLASQMEQYIQGQSRDLIDKAYTKLVSTMFTTLEIIARGDPKRADIVLIENYASFQNSVYDLANVVPTLAKFYHQASESYELAGTRLISSLIYRYFEKLFQFNQKVEELTYTIAAEEIPFQLGMTKTDLRGVLKSSLSGINMLVGAMHRRLQKTLTFDEELFPALWDKCKKEFMDKYESFVRMVTRIYGDESLIPVAEMREILAGF